MGPDMALGDLLALEALRLFVPSSFAVLEGTVGPLTGTSDPVGDLSGDRDGDPVAAMASEAGEQTEAVRALCARLFPAAVGGGLGARRSQAAGAAELRADRRAADPDVLALYLERMLHGALTTTVAAEVSSGLHDGVLLRDRLQAVDDPVLLDVVDHLARDPSGIPCANPQAALEGLLDARSRLPHQDCGKLGVTPEVKLAQVVARLLATMPPGELGSRPDLVARLREAGIDHEGGTQWGSPGGSYE